MSSLLLYLHNDHMLDYQLDNDEQLTSAAHVSWQALPPTEDHLPCTVLVHGNVVTTHQIEVPETSLAKLTKIVPYAIEEQLADAPENLHFAFDKFNDKGLLPVAIVSNTFMNQWLAELHAKKLYIKTIIPDYLALPLASNSWHIYLMENTALIRMEANYGMSIAITQLPLFLQLKLNEQIAKPDHLQVSYTTSQKNYSRELLSKLAVPVTFSPGAIEPLALFNQGLKNPTMLNLLQGGFAVAQAKTGVARVWRLARQLLLASGVVWVGVSIAEYSIFSYKLNQLQQQTTALYQQIMPNADNVANPSLSLQRLTASLQGTRSGGTFLSLLTLAGQQIKNQNITIDDLRFSNNTLTLNVEAGNFQNLEILNQQLTTQGVTVQQTEARTTANGVTARFLLSRKSG